MNSPIVSAIVPIYNTENFIVAALESIVAQAGIDLEIIVVNDGSTDNSREVALSWGRDRLNFRLLDQPNSGPGQARNTGIAAACGEYIAFLDADDLWTPDSLRIRLEAHRTGDCDTVLGLTQAFTAENNTGGRSEKTTLNFVGEPFRFLNVGAGLFKRDTFQRNGGFSPTMSGSEDVDWFLRARDSSLKLQSLQAVTLWHRRHQNNMTRGQSLSNLDFHLALKRSLDRRRAAQALETEAPFEQNKSQINQIEKEET